MVSGLGFIDSFSQVDQYAITRFSPALIRLFATDIVYIIIAIAGMAIITSQHIVVVYEKFLVGFTVYHHSIFFKIFRFQMITENI